VAYFTGDVMTQIKTWWHRFAHEPQGEKAYGPGWGDEFTNISAGIIWVAFLIWLILQVV